MQCAAHGLPQSLPPCSAEVPSTDPRLTRHAPRVRRLREKCFIFLAIIPHLRLRRNRRKYACPAQPAACRHASSIRMQYRPHGGSPSLAPSSLKCRATAPSSAVRELEAGRPAVCRQHVFPLPGSDFRYTFEVPNSDDRASPGKVPSIRGSSDFTFPVPESLKGAPYDPPPTYLGRSRAARANVR